MILTLIVIRGEASIGAFIFAPNRQVIEVDSQSATRFQAHADSRNAQSTVPTAAATASGSTVHAASGGRVGLAVHTPCVRKETRADITLTTRIRIVNSIVHK